ncbi:hypothetical protein WJX72_001364 [[Myrmecia] bisecta]|uniref:Uncharacterized protein n=1 Tax=[Myrmecia] bisecta TaxID=41462 RepID=A0AAW1PS63_9CHLO
MEVLGSNYPIAPFKATLSSIITVLQLGVIVVLLLGDYVFPAMGFAQPPELYQQLKDKKMVVVMGAWFVGNMLQNSLTSSGAFEIYFDGQKIFSKLETVIAGEDRCVSRRSLLALAPLVPAAFLAAPANARNVKDALKAKAEREAALKAAAEKMRNSGRNAEAFADSSYAVSEDKSPNIHTRQEEGLRTATK